MTEVKLGKVEFLGTNDYVAKAVWSKPVNFKALVDKTLGLKMDEEKLLYVANEDKNEITGKGNRYDVIIKYGTDIKIMAETQKDGKKTNKNSYSNYMINRSLNYVSSTHSKHYIESEGYNENKYTYLIWICDFYIPGESGISVFTFKNECGIEFDRIKIVFVSLKNMENDVKINQKTKEFFEVLKSNDLSKFKDSDEEVIELAKTINYINTDADERLLAEMAEIRERAIRTEIELGKIEGREEGRKEGHEETLKKIIINMISNGFNDEEISRLTGVDLETILKITNSIDK